MTAQAISIGFFILLFCQFLVESMLILLNIASVDKNRGCVPAVLKDFIDRAAALRGAQYTIVRSRFSLLADAVSTALLAFVVAQGLFGFLDNLVAALHAGLYIHGILFIAAISLVSSIVSLPFSLFGQFVIEKRFNFNTMTLRLFFLDRLKSLVMNAVIGIPLLLALFFSWRRQVRGGGCSRSVSIPWSSSCSPWYIRQ